MLKIIENSESGAPRLCLRRGACVLTMTVVTRNTFRE
jgi:hypothetical protein